MTRIRDHSDRSYIARAARRCRRSSTGHATALSNLAQSTDHPTKCALTDPIEALKNRPRGPSNGLHRGSRSPSSTLDTRSTGINPHRSSKPHHRA